MDHIASWAQMERVGAPKSPWEKPAVSTTGVVPLPGLPLEREGTTAEEEAETCRCFTWESITQSTLPPTHRASAYRKPHYLAPTLPPVLP